MSVRDDLRAVVHDRVYIPGLRERMHSLTPAGRADAIGQLSEADRVELEYSWEFWGRDEQQYRPGDEQHLWNCCGRGWGKTAAGGHAVRKVVESPELCGGVIGVAGRTASARNAEMVPAILGAFPPHRRPIHKVRRNVEEITFPGHPDVVARLMSGDSEDSFRGPNFGWIWTDESVHWKRLAASWSNIEYALRAGRHPRSLNTTTPKARPEWMEIVFECEAGRPLADPSHPSGLKLRPGVAMITGSSYSNAANLATSFILQTLKRHEGTRLGDQEIRGIILLDVEGALWRWSDFVHGEAASRHDRRVVAVDPSGGTRNAGNAETGIIGLGIIGQRLELLQDASGHHEPHNAATGTGWGRLVIDMYDELGAECVVAETNFGAAMVRSTIELVAQLPDVARARRARGATRKIEIVEVNAGNAWHERAALVQPLWRSGRVVHTGDPRTWVELEHQMRHGDPRRPKAGQRLDRLDAAVHGVHYLTGSASAAAPDLSGVDIDAFFRRVAAQVR